MSDVLQMRYWDDPVLSTVCELIRDTEFGSKLEGFASQLLATMNTYKGIGLAAPQVGVPLQIFVIKLSESNPIVVCNPTLQFRGPSVFGIEGCLSFPSLFDQVERAQFATMRYFNPKGTEMEIELSDVDARVASHEYDHTLGIMFFDRRRMSKQMSKALLRKWDKIKHQYTK